MANTNLSLVSLDPNSIKNAFKSYMKSQDRYKDYDFDGSNISILLDVLSYNTFLNHFYYNMTASEAFLDSAQLKSSVVSRSKELNYVPRSRRSASTGLDIELTATGITSLVIPVGTQFTSTYGLDTYTFTTTSSTVYYSSTGTFIIDDLRVYEGIYLTESFIVNYDDETQRFTLTDPTIDTESLIVTVYDSNEENTSRFTRSSSLLDITSESKVYFLQGFGDGQYEIVFGDGNLGVKPADGAVITIQYRSTQGTRANGATSFVLDSDVAVSSGGTLTGVTITSRAAASGGADAETLDSIRFNAPRFFASQERAIGAEDYRSIILAQFPDIRDVQVYGGELVTESPQYGRVFISAATNSGTALSNFDIENLLSYVEARNTTGITPLYAAPDYTYVIADTEVKYDVNTSELLPTEIQELTIDAFDTYNNDFLNTFDAELRYSKLIQSIDDLDDSIISNETDLVLQKRLTPVLNTVLTFNVDFQNRLYDNPDTTVDLDEYDPTIYSSTFTIGSTTVSIQDDAQGNLVIVESTPAGKSVFQTGIGTVDYQTGKLSISGVTIGALTNSVLNINAVPYRPNRDIFGTLNTILVLDASSSTVTVVPIRA